jgi:hypothetical protein
MAAPDASAAGADASVDGLIKGRRDGWLIGRRLFRDFLGLMPQITEVLG